MSIRQKKSSLALVLLFVPCALDLTSCVRDTGHADPLRPVPAITSLSPPGSKPDGPAFTLSVVGSNFLPGSAVQWNHRSLPTTFVSDALVTAEVSSDLLAQPGAHHVEVVNNEGTGKSNALSFSVPCEIPAPAPASGQTRARLGAYYFDGWSGPLTSTPFTGLPLGYFSGRQPKSGWQDNNACAVEQQLAWAHNAGLDFFVFDWYFNTQANDPGENLNSALQITHSLPDRHGMTYAILYVNSPPFIVSPENWSAAVNEWVTYMADPAYVLVNGKPLLVVYDMGTMRATFGSSAAVASALNQLRAAAVAQGLPGVHVAGGFYAGYNIVDRSGSFPDLSTTVAEGYDSVTMYNYSVAGISGKQPFSKLSEAGKWMWDQGVAKSPIPFIPVAMDGWDARPWGYHKVSYLRSPEAVANFVEAAISWADSNPRLRPEPPPVPPLVLLDAWNELGEGSYLVPTQEDGTSYADALATMLQKP